MIKLFIQRYKLRFFISFVMLLIAVIMFFVLHGTDNLLIVSKINSVKQILPIFRGIQCNSKFVTGYLVDTLCFTSFCLIGSTFNKRIVYIELFLIAAFMEVIQKLFNNLGTFDIMDIFVYFIITLIFCCL